MVPNPDPRIASVFGRVARLALMVGLLPGAMPGWAQGGADPFAQALPADYPRPVPVTRITRQATLTPYPSLRRAGPTGRTLSGGENRGVRIELLQVVRSNEIGGTPAPPGMEAVILFTRWTNVHPRQKVAKSSLESSGDRSGGAGGLFSGGDGRDDMIEMDVAYKIPLPARHLWLIAGGEAFPLRPESVQLPDGMAADRAFGIARLGEARAARMAWFVPKGMSDIELRLFDYENGHVALPVAGDRKKAKTPAQLAKVDAGRSGELELAVLGLRDIGSYAGHKAPDGWRFVAADLLGKSIAMQGKMGALLFADPRKYLWLAGDGATLHYGLPPENGSGSIVFTPEVPSRQFVAFVVPKQERRFRLGLRGRNEVLTLKATAEPPAAAPAPATKVQDPGALTLGLLGVRREQGITILDLLASPESGAKGIEIDAGRQFILKSGKSEYRPDAGLTRRLYRQPPQPFLLPPGTPARFELAFALPADAPPPSLLRYRGFSGDASLPLDGSPIAEAPPGSSGMSASALRPVVVATVPEAAVPAGMQAIGAAGAAPGAAAASVAPVSAKPRFVPPTEKPKLMALTLPAFDPASAAAESEPNNRPGQATPLAVGLAATGSLGPGDEYDWYRFAVEGEPQLWTIEAEGPGLRELALHAAGNRRIAGYEAGGKRQVRLDNLLLVPGQYWIRVRGTGKAGEYHVRGVALGRPDKTAEFEPNDDPSQAQRLRFGETRQGVIDHPSDIDAYRFSLDAPTHARLNLTPPPDTKLLMTLRGGPLRITGSQLAKPGEPTRYEAWLQAGEYQIAIKSDRGSTSTVPYELQLEYRDPFEIPTDIEPNDYAADARSLGRVRHVRGSAGEFDDWDWFRLPEVTQPTRLTLRFTGGSGLNLRVAENGRLSSAELKELSRSGSERVYSAMLSPGVPAFLRVTTRGEYDVDLNLEPEPAAGMTPAVDPALSLTLADRPPSLAAFCEQQQSQPLTFTVTNRTATPQRVRLEAASSADGWRIEPADESPELGPGQSAALRATLIAEADRAPAERLPLFVRVRSDRVASKPLELPVRVLCDAAPQAPKADMPLPASLLGGFDVAWTALGAEPASDRDRDHQKALFDGLTPIGQYYPIRGFPAEITVKLAGGTTRIAGVTLFAAPHKVGSGAIPFTLLASADGTTFHEVLAGLFEPLAREQVFAFPAPVEASQVRLRLAKRDGLSDGPVTALAEFKVIAAPGVSPFGTASPNIADPALGGHLVQVSWPEDPVKQLKGMLTEKVENKTSRIEPLISVDWVVGFHHQRAARITRLEWQNSPAIHSAYRQPEQVAVAASVEGPNGPWLPLADWKLESGDGRRSVLELASPIWARYLRFSVPGNDKTTFWQLAETLRVLEEPTGEHYRSILAEWGHYRRDAYYERFVAAPAAPAADPQRAANNRGSARLLAQSTVAAGKARAGERADWYRIDVPRGMERLELAFRGDGAGRIEPVLEDAKGGPIPLEPGDEIGGARIFRARVVSGGSCFLKVAEAKRSILFVWDESGSIGASTEAIYQSINQMADDIDPQVEAVNLMPLGEGDVQPLLREWSSSPLEVKAAIGAYDRSGGSSNAENTLLAAMKSLAKRQGNRAIILLTDAESPGGTLNSVLWQQMRKVQPRIFTFELQAEGRAEYAADYQDKMQEWAMANHGEYRSFHTTADLDHAYERAACLMRRPAEYTVSWRPAPGRGRLRVVWEKGKSMAGAALELVLDASGSMRSAKAKVNGKRKMEVAREVMHGIINALPDDTRVGLRFYGHRRKEGSKGACEDTELVAPITRLDRKRLNDAVDAVKALGSTPIAYSVARACEDLAKVEGPKSLVVITDGKEECKGDPAATVAACRAQGLDVRVDIVGFALADAKDKRDMEAAAARGGGRFFDAQDRGALANAIAEALAMPFEVFDGRERSIAKGLTGQQGATLYQGNYSVVVRTATGDLTVRDVAVQEGKITTIRLAREGDAIRFHTAEAK